MITMVYEVNEEASTGITYVWSFIRGGGKENKGVLRVKWVFHMACNLCALFVKDVVALDAAEDRT